MKIKDLKKIVDVGAIRQRLDSIDSEDESMDEEIESMSPQKLVELESAWRLGDEIWATNIIEHYEKLKDLEEKDFLWKLMNTTIL